MKHLMNSSRATKLILFVITFLLILIPFFWLKPGEMDLGGDSGRLYFYDPEFLLKNIALYVVSPLGIGNIEPNLYTLPFYALASLIKSILHEPYLIIFFFNALKLTVSFFAVFALIRELLNINDSKNKIFAELSAIIGGLFYIFSPMFIGNFDRALSNHNQVFLNPLILFLLLRFLLTNKIIYIFISFLISIIFSENFAWVSAPPIFAFYPLGILFILSYAVFIRKIKINIKILFLALLTFIFLHSFHFIPTFTSLFQNGSSINSRIFNTSDGSYLGYFYGVLPIAKVSLNILAYSASKQFGFLTVIIPFILILGFLFNAKKQKTIVLTALFFFITFFLITANITNLGVLFYSKLFLIPGFNMFRNFIGQWQFVFYFFYSLLLGQAFYLVISKVSRKFAFIFSLIIGLFFVITAWPFINGSLVNKIHFQSKGVKYAMVIDPQFEKELSDIRTLSDDSKILTLPFTDCCYQVINGINNGAYIGMSTISYLSGKKDFSGYSITAPFSEVLLKLVKEKNYESIKRLLGILNVKYVFYNSDSKIYDNFPSYPYTYVRKYFPDNRKEYSEFVNKLTDSVVFKIGQYGLYSLDKNYYLPHFYIPKNIVPYDNEVNDWYGKTESFFVNDKSIEIRTAYINREICRKVILKNCNVEVNNKEIPKLSFERINPTKYKVKVSGGKGNDILIFSEAFNSNWKVFFSNNSEDLKVTQSYFNGEIEEGVNKNVFFDNKTFETQQMKTLNESRHFQVNGYANAWYITKEDVGNRDNYELIIEMTGQKTVYIGIALSFLTFIFCLLWLLRLLLR